MYVSDALSKSWLQDLIANSAPVAAPGNLMVTVRHGWSVWHASDAPEDYARRILHMFAGQVIKLNIVDAIFHECVRQILKKHHKTLSKTDVVHTGTG